MEIDEANFDELRSELSELVLSDQESALLVRHLQDRIVGHFGSDAFDVWQAKWGLHRHGAEDGLLAEPITLPWENRY